MKRPRNTHIDLASAGFCCPVSPRHGLGDLTELRPRGFPELAKQENNMSHFRRGDLAVTCNSKAPLLNDNHIVRITSVVGPSHDQEVEFGYQIERIDGQNFVLEFNVELRIPRPGGKRVIAHHWQLRPLVKSLPKSEAREQELVLVDRTGE